MASRRASQAEIRASSVEVAEGVATTPAAARLAKQLKIDCPIIQAVNSALIGEKTPIELVRGLLALPAGDEHIFMDGRSVPPSPAQSDMTTSVDGEDPQQ